MTPKDNDFKKGIGAALQSVSKFFGGSTAKKEPIQDNMSVVAPARFRTNIIPARLEMFLNCFSVFAV